MMMAPAPAVGRRACLATICALILSTLLAPCLAAQKNITSTPGYWLLPGVASIPAPIVVAPDQDWWGVDGTWNTFSLLVGNPPTQARVQISTASQQVWVVNRQACLSNITDSAGNITEYNHLDEECDKSRGLTYNNIASSTWRQKGFYRLWLEKWLGLEGNGFFGFDTVSLGLPGERGPTVQNTIIGTLISANFWTGHLGLHPKPTNFSAFEDPVPSLMTTLFEQKGIPSLSFGYTAGSQYRTWSLHIDCVAR
jgi:hypothetical protein